jgi:hypothetical protein
MIRPAGLARKRGMSSTRLAGTSAFLVAAANLAYASSFLIVRPDDPDSGGAAASAFLLAGGLLALPALLGLYRLVEGSDLALLAVLLGVVSALGAAIHGGYDLANAINPPSTALETPNMVDPRGLLTFGFGGLSLLAFAPLLPKPLIRHAALLGVLLLALYVLRLVVLDADNAAIVGIAALVGFVLSPAWYARLGAHLSLPRAATGQTATTRPARWATTSS